ncbi:branched-chain amino acid ABC transporter permease [Mesorhizobium sp. ASY16-5R]|uniref:branched-chain amino acid ABC transporter permease n=1 Tax=Mesorhizobium sp. ASY16-5R TaxID=3445772 RepID=UPI003FA08EBA
MSLLVQSLFDTLCLGSFYALSALGIGLLFGVLRLVNFAHGDFISCAAYALILPGTLTATTPFLAALPLALMIPALLVLAVGISILSYLLVFRALREAQPPILMVASFALSYALQNALLLLYGSRPRTINLLPELNGAVDILGIARVPMLQLVTIAVTTILMLGISWCLRSTSIGIAMRAAAEAPTMARMLGVWASRVMMAAMAVTAVLAVAASLLLVIQTGVLEHRMGVSLMLFAFVGTVIGGLGNLTGAVAGGFAAGAMTVLFQTFLPENLRPFRDVFVFAVVFAILAFRPNGLFPSRHLKERV